MAGDAGTIVTALVAGGFGVGGTLMGQLIAARTQREDCAAPGGYQSGAYSAGWLLVLERFAQSVEPANDR
ncbi:MAG: hypothetical protein LC808_35925 [Actinobacteria bacterium]|nr:hypothetical protein [Actinomycetota bacterium]